MGNGDSIAPPPPPGVGRYGEMYSVGTNVVANDALRFQT